MDGVAWVLQCAFTTSVRCSSQVDLQVHIDPNEISWCRSSFRSHRICKGERCHHSTEIYFHVANGQNIFGVLASFLTLGMLLQARRTANTQLDMFSTDKKQGRQKKWQHNRWFEKVGRLHLPERDAHSSLERRCAKCLSNSCRFSTVKTPHSSISSRSRSSPSYSSNEESPNTKLHIARCSRAATNHDCATFRLSISFTRGTTLALIKRAASRLHACRHSTESTHLRKPDEETSRRRCLSVFF